MAKTLGFVNKRNIWNIMENSRINVYTPSKKDDAILLP